MCFAGWMAGRRQAGEIVQGFAVAIKAGGGPYDQIWVHVPLFVGLGWSVISVWAHFCSHFTPWAAHACVVAGVLYTVGLVPWAMNRLEGHNAVWHSFVLGGSALFYAVVLAEVSRPDAWVGGAAAWAGAGGGTGCAVA